MENVLQSSEMGLDKNTISGCYTAHYLDKTDVVEHANNLLIYKRFEECITWCHKGSCDTKAYPEDQRAQRTCEALSLVAVQAYAELDRWQEVLPYVNQVYYSIEHFPTSVVDTCVRLHAHVKDFLTCSALCSVWLRHDDNLVKPDYCQLVMTYIDCVLIIQRRWDDVKPFLESCPGLDDIKMKDFLKQTQKVKHHIEQENLDKIETIPAETSATECTPDKITKKTDEVGKSWGQFKVLLHALFHRTIASGGGISRRLRFLKHPYLTNSTLFVMLLYILFSRQNFDMLSYPWLMKIWSVLNRLWRAMFSPFYLAK